MEIKRIKIIKELVEEAQSWSFALACWEGGAAANNRLDEFSDIDLIICVEDLRIEESFRNLHQRLAFFSTIEHQWRVPEPTWSGHGQCYYKIANTPPWFFLDIVVIKESSPFKLLERERHGEPVIHFDRRGLVKTVSADESDFWQKMKNRFDTIEASYPFYRAIILKELYRGRALDALAFYRHLLTFYVELSGMKYRPFHYDFGFRYSNSEFPEIICKKIEKFSFVSGLDDIREKVPSITNDIDNLLIELKTSLR